MIISGDSLFSSTSLVGSAYTALNIGKSTIVDGKIKSGKAKRLGLTSLATGATTTAATAYSVTLQTIYRNASTYIESLNDEELALLSDKIEDKSINCENINEELTKSEKQLIKKL